MDFQEMPLSSCFMEVSVVKAILFYLYVYMKFCTNFLHFSSDMGNIQYVRCPKAFESCEFSEDVHSEIHIYFRV